MMTWPRRGFAALCRVGIPVIEASRMAAPDNAPLVVRIRALTDLNDAVLGLGQPITQDLRLLLIACHGDTRYRKQKNDAHRSACAARIWPYLPSSMPRIVKARIQRRIIDAVAARATLTPNSTR
jgi:hypothetical protein